MASDGPGWIRGALWIGVGAAALWAVGLFLGRIPVLPADQAPPAPALTLRATDGRTFDLDSLRGQVVVLNLWASWCGPCRIEIPALARLQDEMAARGLVVIGLNVEELPPERIATLGRELGISYTVAVAATPLVGPLRSDGRLPQTWLLDRQGRVRASRVGLAAESALHRATTRLLAE